MEVVSVPERWNPQSESSDLSFERGASADHIPVDAVEIVTEREGLPRNYRMRADRHYVDQLAAPSVGQPVRMVPISDIDYQAPTPDSDLRPLIESIRAHGIVHPLLLRRVDSRYQVVAGRKRLVAARKLRLATVPGLVHDLTEAEAAALEAADNLTIQRSVRHESAASHFGALQRLIGEHLSAVLDCADMPGVHAGGLQRATSNLMKAHAWRAARLSGALEAIANATPRPARDRTLAAIIDDVVAGFAAEARLSGVVLRAESRDGLSTSGINDGQLMEALAGAVIAVLPLVERAARPTVVIQSSSPGPGCIALDVIQADAPVASHLARHFFDSDLAADRPGGHEAAVGAMAAKSVAERYGGRATLDAIEHGSRLTLTLMLPC
jgi:hypothetical protein